MEELGRKGIPVVCDVADRDAVAAMVARCKSELGPPTIAVANAGIFQTWGPGEDVTPEESVEDELANIPLATPGSAPAKGKGSVGAGKVQCMECGTVNDLSSDVCTNCFFPLPKKKKG